MSDIVAQARTLGDEIAAAEDARTRMTLCRRAVGLGRDAVRAADALEIADIRQIVATLRTATRESRGIHNTNASITRLAKRMMDLLGHESVPILSQTRARLVSTDTATLAAAGQPLPDRAWEHDTGLAGMNAGEFFCTGVGADGRYSVRIRLIEGEEPFLDPKEYKLVVESLPPFGLQIAGGTVYFGPGEQVTDGVSLDLAPGRYVGSIVSLRSGRDNLRHVLTLVRSDAAVDVIHQFPDMREF